MPGARSCLAEAGSDAASGITRRLFLSGGLKATIAAGVMGRMSILDVLAAEAGARREFDGELIAESYGIAHRLRDGTLTIPALAPEGPLHDAIVIGGGVSGLMAAWDLIRGGLDDVVLYEKESYVGGNARKGHANGTDYTCATWSLIRPKGAFLTRLYEDLDIISGYEADGTPKIHPELLGTGPVANSLIDGAWYGGPNDDVRAEIAAMPLSRKERRDLTDFYVELFGVGERKGRDGRPAFAIPIEDGSRDPEVLALDHMTIGEYARRKGWAGQALRHAHYWSSSDFGGGLDEVSAYAFWAFCGLGQGGEDITLPGGNAWVAQRMADKVGRDRIRTGEFAVRVANEGDEVRVTLVDPMTERFTVRRARAAVIACPKHITGRMVPEMSTPERKTYLQYRYGPALIGAASVKRTPVLKGAPLAWFNYGDGPFMQGFLVGDYNSENWRKGDPSRPNVLCLWAPLAGIATRADLLAQPWSHWAHLLADDLESMVPGIGEDLTRLDVYAWGHHMVIPYPGFLTGDLRAKLTQPLGRITFAHSDRNGMPSFELATRAGHTAAQEALALIHS